MKDLDIRIRSGGDDAVAAVSELTEHLRLTDAERATINEAAMMLAGCPTATCLVAILERLK